MLSNFFYKAKYKKDFVRPDILKQSWGIPLLFVTFQKYKLAIDFFHSKQLFLLFIILFTYGHSMVYLWYAGVEKLIMESIYKWHPSSSDNVFSYQQLMKRGGRDHKHTTEILG